MENFTLWHATSEGSEIRFYATAVNTQLIQSGTDEMVSTFLAEMGAKDASIGEWSVLSHFVTDYLSDDKDSDNWEDVWMHT